MRLPAIAAKALAMVLVVTWIVPVQCILRCAGSATTLPRIGFGTYRIGPEHAAALRSALKHGISLIDTSANYGDGRSEETIGAVLRADDIKRHQVTVISKFGYIQGQNLQRFKDGLQHPETVHISDQMKHCIHPHFMRDQLTRSLERLKLKHLDSFLLHNPEYFLYSAINEHTSPADTTNARNQMQTRIFNAFVALEQEVQLTGRIQSYGVSSNSFSLPPQHAHYLDPRPLVALATRAAAQVQAGRAHSWRVVQLPANLVEPIALKPGGVGWWAAKQGMLLLVNRPLNGFVVGKGIRLAEYPDVSAHYNAARHNASEAAGCDEQLKDTIELLDQQRANIAGPLQLDQVLHKRIIPALRARLSGECGTAALPQLQQWLELYQAQVKHRGGVTAWAAVRDKLPSRLRAHHQLLQQSAVQWLLTHPIVSVVLVGTRTIEYVTQLSTLVYPTTQCWPPHNASLHAR